MRQLRARPWRWVALTLVIALPFASLRVARAGEDSAAWKVERLAADAANAYRAADYSRAVELLERAYSIRQVAALLYNLAKAYEKLGNQEKAIELYHRYSDSSDADPKLRVKAEARIAAYEEAHRPRPDEPAPDRPREPEPHPPVVTPPTQPPEPPPVREETAEERAIRLWKKRRVRDRILGLSLGSLGVATAIAGAGVSGAALVGHEHYASTLESEFPKRAERDKAQSEAVASDVLLTVAVAAAAVGSYFLWRGYHRERPPGTRLLVAPSMMGASGVPQGGGLFVRGRF
jgi:tetratricopeptide (TPR) repeat protein